MPQFSIPSGDWVQIAPPGFQSAAIQVQSVHAGLFCKAANKPDIGVKTGFKISQAAQPVTIGDTDPAKALWARCESESVNAHLHLYVEV